MTHFLVIIINREIETSSKLEHLANTDNLTGIFNRRKFEDVFENNTKTNKKFSIILFDIDYFKDINDNYGHKVGDEILKAFSDKINSNIRKCDVFFRWGGEEFIVLANNTELDGAFMMGNKLRKLIETSTFVNVSSITISLGIAEYIEGEALEQLINRADKALYTAKRNGRNRVEVYDAC